MQAASAKLETALKKEPDKLPSQVMSQAEDELSRILDTIRSISGEKAPLPETGNGEIPDDFGEQLKGLLDKLEQYDSEAEEVFEDIFIQVQGSSVNPILKDLKKQIGQYDFDEAAEQVKELINKFGTASGA